MCLNMKTGTTVTPGDRITLKQLLQRGFSDCDLKDRLAQLLHTVTSMDARKDVSHYRCAGCMAFMPTSDYFSQLVSHSELM